MLFFAGIVCAMHIVYFSINFFPSLLIATPVDTIYISLATSKCLPPILAFIIGFHHNLKWNTALFFVLSSCVSGRKNAREAANT